MQSASRVTVVLGTGGTIAGVAKSADEGGGYRAAQLGVEQLVEAVPALRAMPLECEQVAQVDSKDMDFGTWQRLVRRVAHHLAREDVQGIVVTHGTDTLEETAYLLQRVFSPDKPVVLTAAMRPATALLADGPQNLLDAVTVSREQGARGVTVTMAGSVWSALGVRKAHTYRLGGFDAGGIGPVAVVEEGRVRRLRDWPGGRALGAQRVERAPEDWPRVEIVFNHVNADGRIVRELQTHGVDGIVVAGTGNATVSDALQRALDEVQAAGVRVERWTRCAAGTRVASRADSTPPLHPDSGDELTAVQVRVELLLELLAR